jgi:hypothetical protein
MCGRPPRKGSGDAGGGEAAVWVKLTAGGGGGGHDEPCVLVSTV